MPTSAMVIGRGKILGVAAAAAIAGSLIPAGSAQAAASHCTIHSYTPNKVTLDTATVTLTVKPKITGCTIAGWAFGAAPFGSNNAVASEPYIELDPRTLTNADAGKQPAEIYAIGNEDAESDDMAEYKGIFQLLRRSTFGKTLNATPEPVKKGKKISIKATLSRVSWDGRTKGKYIGFPKAKVTLQFRVSGSSTYKNVKTVTAGAGGKIATTVTAGKSGRWRLVFAGISTTSAVTSPSDAVTVKK